MTKNIATAYLRFINAHGGKCRPIFVIRENEGKIYFFDITSKYENKSKYMKSWYFEIKDYYTTGLRKHYWIDTYRIYSLSKDSRSIQYIGELSDSDVIRLGRFLRNLAVENDMQD